MINATRNHAIVIGGSMGGLLAARVLAKHYRQVTLLERDVFPLIGGHRRGVPQGRHTHGLLASGARVIEQHFPGISGELIAGGAAHGDIVHSGRWIHEGAPLARFESGLNGLLVSRPMLEGHVRRRLLALPNVRAMEAVEVRGLASTADQRAVTGVRVGDEVLNADLVVDATGRGSRSGEWLESLGYVRPKMEKVEVSLAYTTRLFRRHPRELNGDLAVILPPTPQGKRGGVMVAQENNRWTVTLISHFSAAAPMELEGFRQFARELHAPDIYQTIRDAEPIGEAATARFPHSQRRRYEWLERFPANYVVFGDSICSFNPIYGQGMSVAALESVALDETLADTALPLWRTFMGRAAKVVDIPWSIACGNDLRMPETVGPRSPMVNFINWYMSKLHRAAHHDRVLSMTFHEVANLLAAPASVLHPKIMARVVWGNLTYPRGGEDWAKASVVPTATRG